MKSAPNAGDNLLVEVAGRQVKITNPHKLYWPNPGITKAEFLSYCARMTQWILPYLTGRPLVLTRYPDGIRGECFYQKQAPDHVPGWVRVQPIYSGSGGRTINYIVCDEPATLIWVANSGAIEWHPWLAAIPQLDHPTFAVIDLDPAEGVGYHETVEVANMVRELLHFLGLRAYAKTSGGSGIHIFIPIDTRYDYQFTSNFVRQLGMVLLKHAPDRITLERNVKRRQGKVYVDYLQNGRQKTLVSVFSPRPRPGAPVSFPVRWNDLTYVVPDDFTLRSVPARLEREGDAFRPALRDRQRLETAFKRLQALLQR